MGPGYGFRAKKPASPTRTGNKGLVSRVIQGLQATTRSVSPLPWKDLAVGEHRLTRVWGRGALSTEGGTL